MPRTRIGLTPFHKCYLLDQPRFALLRWNFKTLFEKVAAHTSIELARCVRDHRKRQGHECVPTLARLVWVAASRLAEGAEAKPIRGEPGWGEDQSMAWLQKGIRRAQRARIIAAFGSYPIPHARVIGLKAMARHAQRPRLG